MARPLAWLPLAELIGLVITLALMLGVWLRGRSTDSSEDDSIIDRAIDE